MRIAIVGGGVSGLVSAHLLARQHEIVLFEAGAHAGGHTNTVRVDTADETHQIDTGFIVFNDRNYPNFERLLDRLRVSWQPSNMSFSVADEHGAFEYNGASPNGVFATRAMLREVWFHRMLAEIPRFQRAAKALLASSEDGPSLGGWLEAQRFSRPFIDRLIVPQAAAVWSADPRQMWSFPARLLVEFFDNHGMLTLRGRPRWRVVRGGSARYVEALTRPFADRIRLGARVSEIRRGEDHVTVQADGQQAERFDHVVIASHSDQALAMLTDASQREREILAAIPYQRNEAVLHTDVTLLPRRRRAWASWNYHLLDEPQPRATVTYHMNRLQSLSSRHQFLVTLNRSEAIDPARIIQSFDYSHPVFTPAGITAQRRIEEISGRNRTHYCGAYWGFGFHEDGVRSAIRVAAGLGVAT
jgi:predicted NAD/FAD-binding protein